MILARLGEGVTDAGSPLTHEMALVTLGTRKMSPLCRPIPQRGSAACIGG